VLDQLQIVARPRTNVGMKLGEALVQIGRSEVIGHDQQVDIGVAVGVPAGHRAEEPGAAQVGPRGQTLSQSPDQLASQTRQSQHRPGGEVTPVERDHRGSTSDGLAHQAGSDEVFDDSTGVAGSDPRGNGERRLVTGRSRRSRA
jgi:hypothetical protein